MNTYKTEFFCLCPLNETRIKYFLEITTEEIIPVEDIIDQFKNYASGFHELIAEDLHKKFGGKQTLVADHHGVTIETTRP
tara:strand:+ start:676 stop:915 length:240 start_codon:yes stop_codon:yes gene_type:complete